MIDPLPVTSVGLTVNQGSLAATIHTLSDGFPLIWMALGLGSGSPKLVGERDFPGLHPKFDGHGAILHVDRDGQCQRHGDSTDP